MKRRKASPRVHESPLLLALEQLGGPLVVLDRELRIVEATSSADALLGSPPRGVLAAKVLCGSSSQRPIAEALAAGRSADATIPSPRGSGKVRVRAEPLRAAGRAAGFVLFLEDVTTQDEEVNVGGMWTRDPVMKHMFHLIEKVAASDSTVLVRGESGTGKELVARAIHAASPRARGPFHAVNCAAMPAALLESELFGHERGAFTGAVRDNPGHFRLADGGTLMLDEVAELPLEVQAKLLRVLETHTVLPVGGRESIKVNVRIIAATHRALRKEVEAGRFRPDLMFRLRVIPVFLPPLRARPGDIALLTTKFLDELNARSRRNVVRLSPDALAALERHSWPGNVRELRNVLEYAFVVGEGPVLALDELPPEIAHPDATVDGEPRIEVKARDVPAASSPEATRILRALERASGNKARAAQALGLSRVTLWRRMKELGLALGAVLLPLVAVLVGSCGPAIDSPAVSITLGGDHACAVVKAGQTYCWGATLATKWREPTAIAGLPKATQIDTNGHHTCAITEGQVHCWGHMPSGTQQPRMFTELKFESVAKPVRIQGIEDASDVATAQGRTCVARRGGPVLCWGAGANGLLGGLRRFFEPEPLPVPGVADAIAGCGARRCAFVRSARNGARIVLGSGRHGRAGPRQDGERVASGPRRRARRRGLALRRRLSHLRSAQERPGMVLGSLARVRRRRHGPRSQGRSVGRDRRWRGSRARMRGHAQGSHRVLGRRRPRPRPRFRPWAPR